MSDGPKPPENTPSDKTGDPNALAWPSERRAMQDELEALRSRAAEFEALKAEQTAAAEAARVKNGEAAALLEERTGERDALAARVAEFEARETKRLKALEARNKERVEAIPEGLRGLVPTGYDAEALSAWLDSSAEALGLAAQRPAGPGPRGGSVDYPAAMIAEAKRHGYTSPDQLAWYYNGPWQRSTNPHRTAEA